MNNEIFESVKQLCLKAGESSKALATASSARKNRILAGIAAKLRDNEESAKIIAANKIDIEAAEAKGTRKSMIDRLRLDRKRIDSMASAIDELILMSDPVGTGECFTRPNGLEIRKIHVPIGVVGIIYEARPNVTVDAAALCIKSGNASVLRGGSDALNSNMALASLIGDSLEAEGFSRSTVSLIENTDRESSNALMQMRGIVDVLIPRGGAGLIRSVVENAIVPVIETGAGNCHIFIDESADIDMAVSVAINAKASRPSVCNAVETMLVHEKIAAGFLPAFAAEAAKYSIEMRGCERTLEILPDIKAASEEDFATEYNDFILAVKIVDSVEEAVRHIDRYSTGHSESIITKSMDSAGYFEKNINSAAVYVNASTRFTDGGEFGLGAEIGISTQKLHVRGPMGLSALTTQKYIVHGNGQIR